MENTAVNDNRASGRGGLDKGTKILVGSLAIVVMAVLIATLIARLTGYTSSYIPDATALETRVLGFRDLPRGVVEVFDWETDHSILRLPSGEGAFLRGVVRSLVRQRAGLESQAATMFTLTRYDDGRLVLADPQTREAIDLVAFGPDNFAVFAQILNAPRADEATDTPW